ncbi:MAG: AbrB/MazE/SpoVT family DNA-binding domain-containing protein [Magnetococcales bacterium]|nr:AbrB/MazE/SpoVT family DNA-binding domain-containing protein [Magnetococcales bacterium]
MTMLRLTSIGNSTGIVFPKEILARLRVEKGDALYVVGRETIELTPYNPEFARQMDLAEEIMRE